MIGAWRWMLLVILPVVFGSAVGFDARLLLAAGTIAATAPQKPGLIWVDWLIICFYGLAMLSIGWFASHRQTSTDEYFTGSRSLHPVLAGLSLFSSVFSSITYLAVPGEIIKHGPVYLCSLAAVPLAYLIVGYGCIPFLT